MRSEYGTIEQDGIIVKIPRELFRRNVKILDLTRVKIERVK